jgi:hypothetical protein
VTEIRAFLQECLRSILRRFHAEIAFFGRAVGETNEDLKTLIGAAAGFPDPGFPPIRNGELFRWRLEHGLLVLQTITLMSLGLYNTPRGAFPRSILR